MLKWWCVFLRSDRRIERQPPADPTILLTVYAHAQSYKEHFLLTQQHRHQRQHKMTSNSCRAATREASLLSIADAIRPPDPRPGDARVAMRRGHSVSHDGMTLLRYVSPSPFGSTC